MARRPSAASLLYAGCFPYVFAAGWSLVTLAFLGFAAGELASAVRSAGFVPVRGTVTRSELERHHDMESGLTYSLDIEYVYTAGGRRYTGTRYDGIPINSDDRGYYEDVLATLPVDRTVTVYHDPDAPAEAVLVPGVRGAHLTLCLFLTPFTAVMLGGWWFLAFGRHLAQPWWGTSGPRPVVPAVLGAAGGTGFLLTFATLVPFGFHPPLWAPAAALGVCAAAGVAAGVLVAVRGGSDAPPL